MMIIIITITTVIVHYFVVIIIYCILLCIYICWVVKLKFPRFHGVWLPSVLGIDFIYKGFDFAFELVLFMRFLNTQWLSTWFSESCFTEWWEMRSEVSGAHSGCRKWKMHFYHRFRQPTWQGVNLYDMTLGLNKCKKKKKRKRKETHKILNLELSFKFIDFSTPYEVVFGESQQFGSFFKFLKAITHWFELIYPVLFGRSSQTLPDLGRTVSATTSGPHSIVLLRPSLTWATGRETDTLMMS